MPVTLRVDGQEVATEQLRFTLNPIDHTIEVPVRALPTGEDMPVRIEF